MSKKSKSQKVRLDRRLYNELWLLVFALTFAAIGSYYWMRSFALPEDTGVLVQSHHVSGTEKAWLDSVAGASLIILVSGPLAALFFWWVWRRSEMQLFSKIVLTAAPLLTVMALT